jgi:hypothetical protein
MKKMLSLLIVFVFTQLLTGFPIQEAHAATINVNTTTDILDAAVTCEGVTTASLPGPDGGVSLREAICAANNNPGPDTITFGIPGVGVRTIQPTSYLPFLVDDGTSIRGYSQPGASPAHDDIPATILIELDGSLAGAHGITITSSNNLIQGLVINRFSGNGINILNYEGRTAANNQVAGNHIGTNASGDIDLGNGWNGVYISWGAVNNLVGGEEPAMRNVLSGNEMSGVEIHGSGTDGNRISGNFIGTRANGMEGRGNSMYGVRIYGGARNNKVGGNTSGERNVISGNTKDGVRIWGEETSGNILFGNYIGTTQYGIAPVGNGENGVLVGFGAQNNIIGGSAAKERNVISGNHKSGAAILLPGTTNNQVKGNFIGTDAFGIVAIGNLENGVLIGLGAQNNTIGGDTPGERNILSGNLHSGVNLSDEGTENNTVSANYIGLNVDASILGNHQDGIIISMGAQNNTIGGESDGDRNIISGNGDHGIRIRGTGTDINRVSGNTIGLNPEGDTARGNHSCGVYIHDQAKSNLIGPSNVISANYVGVCLSGPGTSSNLVVGNNIGLDAGENFALGNIHAGLSILDGASENLIGGEISEFEDPRVSNVISGNLNSGVQISGAGTSDNIISGNLIGFFVGNGEDGIVIDNGAANNIIGPFNMIQHNSWNGIYVHGAASIGNRITQNQIRLNYHYGIQLQSGGNGDIDRPVISSILANQNWLEVTGTTCSGCLVEFFFNLDDEGEGNFYCGSAAADASGAYYGTFEYLPFPYLTATTTDFILGTSQFSDVHLIEFLYFSFLPLAVR